MKALKRLCAIVLAVIMGVGFMPMMPGVNGVANATDAEFYAVLNTAAEGTEGQAGYKPAYTLSFYYDGNKSTHTESTKTVYADLPKEASSSTGWGYESVCQSIKNVVIDASVANYSGLKSTYCMFFDMKNADNISGCEYLNVGNVTNMASMFDLFAWNSTSITAVPDVSDWDTSKVTSMGKMFVGYAKNSQKKLNPLDLSCWDISMLKYTNGMFAEYNHSCSSGNPIVYARDWSTINASVESIDMFAGSKLKNAPIFGSGDFEWDKANTSNTGCFTKPIASITTQSGTTKYASVQEAINAAESGQTVKMIADSIENVEIASEKNVILDLNGHVLKAKEGGSVINNKGTLTIKDSGPTTPHYFEYKDESQWVATSNNTGAITVDNIASNTNNGAIIEVLGGCITGGTYSGVLNNNTKDSPAKFTMHGGNIVGNASGDGGGGVCCKYATATMIGGRIIGNFAIHGGGGVNNIGSFTMNPGVCISHNVTEHSDGGVYNDGTFIMNGGSIDNNKADDNGGVLNSDHGSFTMNGGSIDNNKAGDTGGVSNYGSFTMNTGSSISHNEAYGDCGGVYNGGTFTMKGGNIDNNKAGGFAGGVYQDGSMIVGGTAVISNNTAATGNNLTLLENIALSTDTDSKPTSGMNVGVTLLGREDPNDEYSDRIATTGQFTTNGTDTDIQYFHSDSDRYYVLYNADHLELAELNVKLADTTNGTITVNDKSAATGTNVTITATPSKGYEVDTITVKDASNTNIPISTGRNGTYKFTMPTDTNLLPVTVSATFKLKPTPKEPEPVEMSNCEFILDVQALTYTGKAQHPTILIKDADGNILVEGTDYTVEYPKSTKVGTYTITVTGLGKYKGSGTVTYTINPANKTAKKFKSVKAGKNSLTLQWGKASKSYKSQISGYQIMYSTSKDFAKSSTKNAYAKASANTKKLSKLKSKKSYYLKMRAYKTVNGKKYYSEWSKTVVKKTK